MLTTHQHNTDRALVAAAQAGDTASFGELVVRYESRVVAVARAHCAACSAEDLAQTAFVDAWRGLAGFDGERPFAPWLYAIARNTARRARHRRLGEPTCIEPVDSSESLPALGLAAGWGADPEKAASVHEQLEHVQRALSALAQPDRELLWLRDVEGFSGEEAAATLGIPVPTLKSRLHRARLRLMAELQQEAR